MTECRFTPDPCCNELNKMMHDRTAPLRYNAPLRLLCLLRTTRAIATILNFCPWCGRQFPRDLRDEYFTILEQEHGIDPLDVDDVPLPEEFKSDAWWRKRGL